MNIKYKVVVRDRGKICGTAELHDKLFDSLNDAEKAVRLDRVGNAPHVSYEIKPIKVKKEPEWIVWQYAELPDNVWFFIEALRGAGFKRYKITKGLRVDRGQTWKWVRGDIKNVSNSHWMNPTRAKDALIDTICEYVKERGLK